jgi:biopolymer transport protein ExbD
MVDLGFLLITFFIFTTSMAEKRTTNLLMPKEGKPADLAESKALTAILDKNNKVFVYAGKWNADANSKNVVETNYNLYQGLGSLIRAKQKQLQQNKDGLMLLIKPLNGASYQNVIDALDEAVINNVQRYVIVEATQEEKLYIQNLHQ